MARGTRRRCRAQSLVAKRKVHDVIGCGSGVFFAATGSAPGVEVDVLLCIEQERLHAK